MESNLIFHFMLLYKSRHVHSLAKFILISTYKKYLIAKLEIYGMKDILKKMIRNLQSLSSPEAEQENHRY